MTTRPTRADTVAPAAPPRYWTRSSAPLAAAAPKPRLVPTAGTRESSTPVGHGRRGLSTATVVGPQWSGRSVVAAWGEAGARTVVGCLVIGCPF